MPFQRPDVTPSSVSLFGTATPGITQQLNKKANIKSILRPLQSQLIQTALPEGDFNNQEDGSVSNDGNSSCAGGPRPSDTHKIVRFNAKVRTLEIPGPDEPTPRHSYVFGEEVLRAEHTVQPHDSIAKPDAKSVELAWERETILSLDGGGVRGYSSLLILQELMGIVADLERSTDPKATSSAYSRLGNKDLPPISNDTKSTSHYLPCHYFNYIAGTSTGGLVAIMLGRLRMDINDCIEEYENLSASVFQEPSLWLEKSSTNYDQEVKWKVLQNRFDMLRPIWPSPSEGREQSVLFNSDPCRCRTLVCALESTLENETQIPVLFRSYHHPMSPIAELNRFPIGNPSTPDTSAIWQVARATSAAPFYSKPFRLDNHRYYDAAMNLNNPSYETLCEVIKLADDNPLAIDVLLSVGGGNAEVSKLKSENGGGSLEKDIADISDSIHRQVRRENQKCYKCYRLDVDEGLQDVRLNEWDPDSRDKTTLQKIREATTRYLQRPEVRDQFEACAANLVKRRVDRAEIMRWEYFATGIHYKCPKEGCCFPNSRFPDRNELLDHLRRHHNCPPPDYAHYREVETLLDRGRTNEE